MDLLTISEVAETLKVSHSTIRRLISRGELVAYKVGNRGQLRVKKRDLERYVSMNRVDPLGNIPRGKFSKEG